jgi:hypothetical protein
MDRRKISPPFQLPLRHLQYKSIISDSRHSKSLVENRKKIRRETLVRSWRSGCDVFSESEKRGGAEREKEVREVRVERVREVREVGEVESRRDKRSR